MNATGFVHIKFGSNQFVALKVSTKDNTFPVKLPAIPGEMMKPHNMNFPDFSKKQKSLSGGMSSNDVKLGNSKGLMEISKNLKKVLTT
eukprot:UN10327